MSDKADSEKKHALRRLKQRRGIKLSDAEYDHLCDLIRAHLPCQCSRDVKFFLQTSVRVSHWAVNYREEWMLVIYDSFRNRIVTVLESEALCKSRYRPALKARHLHLQRRNNKWILVPKNLSRLYEEPS